MADARPMNLRAATAQDGPGKTKYHIVNKNGFAACGADVLLGLSVPSADVPPDCRCRRSLCSRLFSGADEDARGVNSDGGKSRE